MIVKVSGKIDGKEVIFERAEGDQWNVAVPYDLDGMYVVELTAENDAGNIAYCTKMLLIVDPATLCVRLVPLDYMVEVVPEDCKVTVIPEGLRCRGSSGAVSSYRRARSALCGGNLSDTRKGVLL